MTLEQKTKRTKIIIIEYFIIAQSKPLIQQEQAL